MRTSTLFQTVSAGCLRTQRRLRDSLTLYLYTPGLDLSPFPSIQTFYLSKNRFVEVPGGFDAYKSLMKLDLSNNPITSLDFLTVPETLIDLDLSNTKITWEVILKFLS